MLAKYGLYLKVETYNKTDNKTNFIPITEELEETIISKLGIWEEGKFTMIKVTYSQNRNDEASSAGIWNPNLSDNTTVGQFAVFSLMKAIDNRESFKRFCNLESTKREYPVESTKKLHELEKVEAKALTILEDLIGSEKLAEVKERIESTVYRNEIYQIIEELNLFSKERKQKRT